MAEASQIRVAIIGLSASAVTSWAADAHLPGLQTKAGLEKYRIVALCNSSIAAAEASIKAYGLPPDTRAYGNPDDLAADPDIDFVICNTRVDKHYETTLPSIKAGKDFYIEWPISSNKAEIDSLVKAAEESGSRALVGLQGRWTPAVLKIKEILDSGVVGRLLSSEVRAYGGSKDREILPVGLKYFAERQAGGNPITIGFGHVVDFVQSVVGELDPASTHTHFQLQRPQVKIRDPKTSETIETITSDIPDLLSLHGFVSSARTHHQPATLTFYFRRGQPFPGTPSLTWTLNGTAGEIRLVALAGISLQADAYQKPVTIQVHHHDTDSVENVEWQWNEEQQEVPIRARSVQTVLYAYADWKKGVKELGAEPAWVEIKAAARRAEQIGGWLDDFQV